MDTLESLRKRPVSDLVDEKDLHSNMSMGIVITGRQIDLLRLKTLIDEAKDLRRVHHQITFEHLAIVKKDEWEEFKKWREVERSKR